MSSSYKAKILGSYVEIPDYFTTYNGCASQTTKFKDNNNNYLIGTVKDNRDVWVEGITLPLGDANGKFTWCRRGSKPSFGTKLITVSHYPYPGFNIYIYNSILYIGGVAFPASYFPDAVLPRRLIIVLQGAGGGGGSQAWTDSGCGGGGGGLVGVVLDLTKAIHYDDSSVNDCYICAGGGGAGGTEGSDGEAGEDSIISTLVPNVGMVTLVSAQGGKGGSSGNGVGGAGGTAFRNTTYPYYTYFYLLDSRYNTDSGYWYFKGGDGGSISTGTPPSTSPTSFYYSTFKEIEKNYAPNIWNEAYGRVYAYSGGGQGGGASRIGDGGEGAPLGNDGGPGERGGGGGGAGHFFIGFKAGGDGGDGEVSIYY